MRTVRHIFLLLIFLTGLLFTSCKDWLTVYPEDDLVKEEYWKTKEQVEGAVLGCYRSMLETGVMERFIQFGELRSDNVTGTGGTPSADQTRFLENNITSSLGLVQWGSWYTVINNCNTVLTFAKDALKSDPTFTEAKLKTFEGEVKALRALLYFNLVRCYRDVPLILTPSVDDQKDYAVAKSSEVVILEQIIADLKEAKTQVMETYSDHVKDKGRITRDAIRAILADVYLWKGDYQASIDECNEIIKRIENEESTLMLVAGEYMYNELFYKGSSYESIFELQFDVDGKRNTSIYSIYGQGTVRTGNLMANVSELLDLFPNTNDMRKKDGWYPGNSNFIFKYVGKYRTEDNAGISTYTFRDASETSNWIFYRLADVYLMKAEAMIELDKDALEIVTLINITYQRANEGFETLDPTAYSGKSTLRKLLRDERQREFLFEGKRWFDMIRFSRQDQSINYLISALAKKVVVAGLEKLKDTNSWFLPIPYNDIVTSMGKLEQNPFYVE